MEALGEERSGTILGVAREPLIYLLYLIYPHLLILFLLLVMPASGFLLVELRRTHVYSARQACSSPSRAQELSDADKPGALG